MERANDGIARYDAVGQRPAAVLAAILQREEFVAEIKNRDLLVAKRHRSSLAKRNVFGIGHTNPSHKFTLIRLQPPEAGFERTAWDASAQCVRATRPSQ